MERKIHVADDLHAGIAIERFTVLENDLVRVWRLWFFSAQPALRQRR
jgi:hypothetical protein